LHYIKASKIIFELKKDTIDTLLNNLLSCIKIDVDQVKKHNNHYIEEGILFVSILNFY
jgi:hypothetical protein